MATRWITARLSTAPRSRRFRRVAWVIGGVVLAAVSWTCVWLLRSTDRLAARLTENQAAVPLAPTTPNVPALPFDAAPASAGVPRNAPQVRGLVRDPGGEPAQGATVSVQRALTAWPEWRAEPLGLEQAVTGRDGVFQFRIEDVRGLLVRFEHPDFCGGFVEVPLHGEPMELQLLPGFELFGVVANEAGAPIGNARIALESVPGESRRVEVRTTAANGRYSFTNMPAGPVRLVARHEAWQPIALPAIVVGDQRRVDLKFERPAMAPLRGRVTSASTLAPIEGALVQLLPLNSKLGLVDPGIVRTDKDGGFLVTGLARGTMRLVVRHAEHGAVITTQTVGVAAADLQIELPRRSAVVGQLVVDSGPPLWRGDEILQVRDSVGQLAFAALAKDGTFQLAASMSPGKATVRVLDDAFAFQRSYTTETDVMLDEALTNHLELVVMPPSVLKGRLVDAAGQPLAGATLTRTKQLAENAKTISDAAAQFDLSMFGSQVAQLVTSDRDEVLATSDKDGRFEIRGVKPGPLLVRAALRGYGSRLLLEKVTGDGSKDLGTIPLMKGRRMQGTVFRGNRPFAGATVLVVGSESQAMVLTDGAGAWSVEDLMPGEYRVRARLPSQPAGSRVRTERVLADGPTPRILIVLEAGRAVRGTVRDSEGEPLAGAIVSVRGAMGATAASDSNGDFVIELPERAVELQVALADRSRSTMVAVPVREQRIEVRLDTPPSCSVTATVAGLPGRKRLTSAVLRLTQLDQANDETRSRWIDMPDGELQWTLCPTGRVRIEIWCDGFAPFVVERELTAKDVHSLGDVLLEPGCRFAGIVKGKDGAPVADASVMLGEEADLDLIEARTRSAADGSFQLTGVSGRSSRLVVRAPGYAPRLVDLQLPRDVLSPTPLVVALEAGSTIRVDVAKSQAREGAVVQLRRDGRLLANADVDELGRAWFANRSAGTYSVQLLSAEGAGQVVVVESGTAEVRVSLQ